MPTGTSYSTTSQKHETIKSGNTTYYLVEEKTDGQEKGTVTEGKTEVTYVYEESGSVVNYVD